MGMMYEFAGKVVGAAWAATGAMSRRQDSRRVAATFEDTAGWERFMGHRLSGSQQFILVRRDAPVNQAIGRTDERAS